MDKFTKEQVTLFTIIGVVVMLIAFFFIHFGGQAPVEYFSRGAGWFGIICLVLDILAPVYLCLYLFKDNKALEPLKPIMGISPSLAFALPLIALGLTMFAFFFEYGWPVILYGLAGAAVLYIGQNSK